MYVCMPKGIISSLLMYRCPSVPVWLDMTLWFHPLIHCWPEGDEQSLWGPPAANEQDFALSAPSCKARSKDPALALRLEWLRVHPVPHQAAAIYGQVLAGDEAGCTQQNTKWMLYMDEAESPVPDLRRALTWPGA